MNKPIYGLGKKIYYEKAQHLTFLKPGSIKYEAHIQKKLTKYIQRGNVVFDIGANIGQYSLFFSEKVGEEGQVVAIEPDNKNFAFLSFNIEINCCSNVTCLHCGIGEVDGELLYHRDSVTGGRRGSFVRQYVGDNYQGNSITVKLKTDLSQAKDLDF
ncbi:MAG TPA: FkbM family methyltransferase [Saprospiraceae bacterium]|nr:FkbM family methyltransferase [Saprospiraceae bacterium]HMQ84681.1 FkbM family methyltransferase [Saprospiraceae bacterium]